MNPERAQAKRPNSPSIRNLWLTAVLFPAAMFVCDTMYVWPAPWFLGEVGVTLLFVGALLSLGVLIALGAGFWHLAKAIAQWKTPGVLLRNLSQTLACAVCVALSILAILGAGRVQRDAFARAADRGNAIVDALARFRRDHGRYPEGMAQLVPDYLPQIPSTGLIGYPRFEYKPDMHDIRRAPGEYELRIFCPSGGINFDRFIYWPSQDYPETIQGNRLEHFASGWVYVHE